MTKPSSAVKSSSSPSPSVAQFHEIEARRAAATTALADILGGQPPDPDLWMEHAVIHARAYGLHAFETGRALTILKEILVPGTYTDFIANKLGMSPRWAQSLVAFTRGCLQIMQLSAGKIEERKLAQLDRKKLALLSQVAPDHADELADTGTIDGRTIDDYDAMTRDELAAMHRKKDKAIATQRKQVETGIKQLADMKDKLDHYELCDDTAIRRACRECQERISAALATFIRMARPAAAKHTDPTPVDLAHLHATKTWAYSIIEQLTFFINDTFPAATEMPIEDIDAIRGQVADHPTLTPSTAADPRLGPRRATIQSIADTPED